MRNVCVKSDRNCTNRISAEKNEFSVTPASSSTLVDRPRCRARARPYTIATAPSEPAKLAIGTAENPAMPDDSSNVSASIAPSAAPADTPSVNGVASGLRSSACSTTPDAASDEPTSAPASTRGSRATKKICASALSANGIDESKTRRRLIEVEPTSGASRQTTTAATPKSSQVSANPAARCSRRGAPRARARWESPSAVRFSHSR